LREKANTQKDMTPLDYMLHVMRSPYYRPDMRLAAAKAAAPYMHRVLKSIDLSIGGTITVKIVD
jgi:hypothetical protein